MQIPNPQNQNPKISESAWISETAVIVGNVTIKDKVFVGPYAVIRADEPGSSIVIGRQSNVQDNVVIHALSNSEVVVSDNTSLAHGCIVHGPCHVSEGCFVGFGSVVFDCNIGENTAILHNSTVCGVDIPDGKVVKSGKTIDQQDDVKALSDITNDLVDFKKSVVKANIDLVTGYKSLAQEA